MQKKTDTVGGRAALHTVNMDVAARAGRIIRDPSTLDGRMGK